MAFAVISLLESYYHIYKQKDIQFSPQFLYALCINAEKNFKKENGGIVSLNTVFDMIKTYGIAKEEDYNYNPYAASKEYGTENLGFATIPNETTRQMQSCPENFSARLYELQKNDRLIRFDDVKFKILDTPTSFEQCKQYLRGDNYHPMPVVICCELFESINYRKDQWIPTPLKNDKSFNHAMLVTDYEEDNKGQNGFFWVLNWEPSPQEDPAHEWMLRMPYDYYGHHVHQAATIEMSKEEYINLDKDNTLSTTDIINSSNIPPVSPTTSDSPNVANDFFSSIQENLKQSAFQLPYDFFQIRKPLLYFLFKLFFIKFKKKHIKKAYEPCSFKKYIEKNIPNSTLQGTVKIISLCKDESFRIIAAFLKHTDNHSSISPEDCKNLQQFIKDRCIDNDKPRPHDLVVIVAENFDANYPVVDSPPTIICTPTNNNLWDYRLPEVDYSNETINFLLHALPGNDNVFTQQIVNMLKNWEQTSDRTIEALRKKLTFHTSVPDAFLKHWLNKGEYGVDIHGYIYKRSWLSSFLRRLY